MRLEVYQCDEVKYSYSINGTYSSNASDYDILGKELHDAGVSYPKYGFSRHHVIPLNAPQTNSAREILYNYDIQINSVADASLYRFGMLTSNIYMAWTRTVCERLKSDYSYSNTVVYNNFPWCNPTSEQQARIEQTHNAFWTP